ncbi:sigma-54-dependent transcriptional regulator [Mucilaginibacter sp. X4EP1]|uniref:sigma-54-dependent transcriptional regulator n=1 Tax=Mucilaginibacter sp. X4EP1 TaxID=2723092 RepID=UPI002169A859|nr:sigma-54 dependent transcriptional regulator [Mucilaginibacter sp. X4EP1]MCS3811997.1 DNA-binding NtrC family response regulator [Mucilaginibacter sp. X4EP1]
MAIKVLIVEDQFIEANNLKHILIKAAYEVCTIARSVPQALQIIGVEHPDMVLLDIFLDGPQTGIDLAYMLREKKIAYVFLSANSNKQTLNAVKETNPYGFLVKPFRRKDVIVMLEVALHAHQQKKETQSLSAMPVMPPAKNNLFPQIIGQSKILHDVLEQTKIVGPTDISVLLLGESGTGKELIAQAIHDLSNRSKKKLVVVNCGTIPATLIESELFGHEKGSFTGASDKRIGKFEEADGGTLFLDEIGELPLDLQVKFLRVIQQREIEPLGGKKKSIDIRVIAATNRDLEEEMAAGRFRMDLFYRLNVFPITLPPLRDRKEDIPVLANHFLNRFSQKEKKLVSGLSDEVIGVMQAYHWPGNIRELQNIMDRSALLANGQIITSVPIPVMNNKGIQAPLSGMKTMTETERDHIVAALEMCRWQIYGKGGAAEVLDMNGATLHSRMKKLGIKKKVIPS